MQATLPGALPWSFCIGFTYILSFQGPLVLAALRPYGTSSITVQAWGALGYLPKAQCGNSTITPVLCTDPMTV